LGKVRPEKLGFMPMTNGAVFDDGTCYLHRHRISTRPICRIRESKRPAGC
jgi:hypothetical protein